MFIFFPLKTLENCIFLKFLGGKKSTLVWNGFITLDNFLTHIGLMFCCLPPEKKLSGGVLKEISGSIWVERIKLNKLIYF